MTRRTKEAKLRLEKISEASSPENKREKKTEENSNSRLIPFAPVSPLTSTIKRSAETPEDRSKELNNIRQDIMDRRQRLNLWQQAFSTRLSKEDSPKQLIRILMPGLKKLCQHPDTRRNLLYAARKGRMGLLVWLLNWLRQLFSMIRTMLAQRHIYSV